MVTDADGNGYIASVASCGPLILGHAHAGGVEWVREAAGRGTSLGAPTEAEAELAERIVDAVPSIEMLRLVSSGTEGTVGTWLVRGGSKRKDVLEAAGVRRGRTSLVIGARPARWAATIPTQPRTARRVSTAKAS